MQLSLCQTCLLSLLTWVISSTDTIEIAGIVMELFRNWNGCARCLRYERDTTQPSVHFRSGELRTQKLNFRLVRTQSLNVLPLKPGVGQYIAIHATLTARDFFLAYFYPSLSSHLHFFPKPPPVFPCWLWLTQVPV